MNKTDYILGAATLGVIAFAIYQFWPESTAPNAALESQAAALTDASSAPVPAPVAPLEPAETPTQTYEPVVQPEAPAEAPAQAEVNQAPSSPSADEVKSITNNLRQFASAAQQYMLDHGATQAGYDDLVGTGTENYLRMIEPVDSEDYHDLVVHQTDTQLSVQTPDGTVVPYNM
jgi:hypothetical protein